MRVVRLADGSTVGDCWDGAGKGVRPVGFRAPGYAIDETVYTLLEERGYLYDSSLLPTF